MNDKQTPQKQPKSLKTVKKPEGQCSRVGPDFQAIVPEVLIPEPRYPNEDRCIRELQMWSPDRQPTENEIERYIKFASQYKYDRESALLLLHWHKYDIRMTMDDIPNYVPISNKWTKREVKRFLKSLDSKPRKNFVETKIAFPARRMGEIGQLYYAIAAPFKAQARVKHRSNMIQRCFTRAVQNDLISSRRCNTFYPPTPTSHPMAAESTETLEHELESYLVDMYGHLTTRSLLGHRLLMTPDQPMSYETSIRVESIHHPVQPNESSDLPNSIPNGETIIENSSFTPQMTVPTALNRTDSSGASSHVGSDTAGDRQYELPFGVHYVHSEFLNFLSTPESKLVEEEQTELDSSENMNEQLFQQARDIEFRSRSLLSKIGMLQPACGFPEVSYRWTKTELALVLTAMAKYGPDFARIARTIGSKTESFVRDFYNQCRHLFPLDDLLCMSENSIEKQESGTDMPERLSTSLSINVTESYKQVKPESDTPSKELFNSVHQRSTSHSDSTTVSPISGRTTRSSGSIPADDPSIIGSNSSSPKAKKLRQCRSSGNRNQTTGRTTRRSN